MSETVPRLLVFAAVILFLLCPLTFLAGTFAPRTLGFLDPIVCPSGHTLDNQTEEYSSPGSYSVSVTIVCRNPAGRAVDAAASMLFLLFALPVFGVLCFVLSSKIKEAYGKK